MRKERSKERVERGEKTLVVALYFSNLKNEPALSISTAALPGNLILVNSQSGKLQILSG